MSLADKNHFKRVGGIKIKLTTGRKWKNKVDQNPQVKSEVYISGNNAKTRVWDCPTFGERDRQSGCCWFWLFLDENKLGP